MNDRLEELARQAEDARWRRGEADGKYGQALGELVRMASALGDGDRLLCLAYEAHWDWIDAHDRRSEVLVAARRAGVSRAQIAQRLRTMGEQREVLLDAIDALLEREARDALVARERAFPDPPRPYTHVVGRVLPSRLVLAAEPDGAVRFFVQAHDQPVDVELPDGLATIEQWPDTTFDSENDHCVAGVLADGSYERLAHFCTDQFTWPGGHQRPGHHTWGYGGHGPHDLTYSLLRLPYGRPFKLGPTMPDADHEALLFPGLLNVIRRLPRGGSWRMDWERLGDIATVDERCLRS